MNLQATLDYLYELKFFGELRTDRINKVLALLGNPQQEFKSIHVAGTNGKGSTCALIQSVLKSSGISTGLYTSPHLTRFNERIRIGNQEITDEEIITLVQEIKRAIEPHNLQPSFFEFTTALAFLYFARKSVEYAVIETGLGGRLDATNVLHPVVTVITNISQDHTEVLGEEVEKIAMEKAGIIKAGVPLITGEQNEKLVQLFKKKCELLQSDFVHVTGEYTGVTLPGAHQQKNAGVASYALELLKDPRITEESMREGLKAAFIPGRLEWIENTLLDCAHNAAGIGTLAEYLKQQEQKFTLIFGLREGKSAKELLEPLLPYVKKIILTESSFKPKPVEEMAVELQGVAAVQIAKSREEALERAKSCGEPILITGSLYLVGDCRGILKSIEPGIITVQY